LTTQKTETIETTKPETHRLTRKICGKINTWTEWQEYFRDTDELSMLLGLLHEAPSIRWSKKEEVIAKYSDLLELADGYSAIVQDIFLNEDERKFGVDWREAVSDNRQEVARKALWALTQSLFKDDKKASRDNKPWMHIVLIPEIYEKLLWFFDDSDRKRGGWSNTRFHLREGENEHPTQVTVKFLQEFLIFAWNNRDYFHVEEDVKNMLFTSRPHLLRIFYYSENLDWFLSHGNHAKLDEASMKQLKELVLWGGGTFSKDSPPYTQVARYSTINQALYDRAVGSEIYTILVARKKEEARRLAEKRREQNKQDEERRERQRIALEKEKEQIDEKLKRL